MEARPKVRNMLTEWRHKRRHFQIAATLASVLAGLSTNIFGGGASQSTLSFSSDMHRHYDAAYRYQSAGDKAQAEMEYRLFLADALHAVANGRANIGEYAKAVPLFDEALTFAPNDVALLLDYAGAALYAKDSSKSKLLAQNAVKLAPNRAQAHRELARALWDLREKTGAIEQFKTTAALEPIFENEYAVAAAYLSRGDKEIAASAFAELVGKFGDAAAIHMYLGRAYGETGYPELAIPEFKKALAKDDSLPGAHYSLGVSYMAISGEAAFSLAEAEFRKELAIQPSDSLSYSLLGRIALKRHNLQEAEIDLIRASSQNPQNPDTFLLLAQLYAETSRSAYEENALRKAITATLDPASNHYAVEHAHYRLGRLLLETGNVAEGKKELHIADALLLQRRLEDDSIMSGEPKLKAPLEKTRVASATDMAAESAFEKQAAPLIAASYNNLGVNAAIASDYSAAAGDFMRAAEWNPTLHGLDANWGRAAYAAHLYEEAAGPLSRSLQSRPDDSEIRSMLGLSQYMIQAYRGALETMRPLEDHLDAIPLLALAYADSMVKTGDYSHGMERLQAIQRAGAESAMLHRALGEAYASAGNQERAVEELRAAVRMDPADVEAKYSLALSVVALGGKAESETLLSELADAGSREPDVYFRLGLLQLERGAVQASVSSLQAAAKMNPRNRAIHHALADAYRRSARPEDAEREEDLSRAPRDRQTAVNDQSKQD
jgi:tetratricopeptide (TPR) repeat protein